MLVLRLLHIVLGVFWAGAIFAMVLFVQPSVRAMGPDGGKFMMRFRDSRFFTVLPVAAILTVLTGIDLYRRVSLGFNPDWIGTPHGMSLTIGGLAGILALVIGLFIMRPATMRALDLGAEAQRAEGPARDAIMAQVEPLRARATLSGRLVAVLLLVAVVTMAVARYQ